MHEKISDIQNSFWTAYRDFIKTKDMRQYNMDVNEIIERYKFDKPLCDFCVNLKLTWAPIMNELKRWAT